MELTKKKSRVDVPRLGVVHLALEKNAFNVGIFGQCLGGTCAGRATAKYCNLVFGARS